MNFSAWPRWRPAWASRSESVRRKISRGDLAAIKLGLGASPLRIARAELDHYIRIHQVVPR